MNKLKQIAFILVLALSLTTFAACGKNNKDMNNGTNNHSVTENGTDKNGIDYGTTGEHMRDAAENAKDAVEDTGEAIKNGVTGDTDVKRDHVENTTGNTAGDTVGTE